VPGLPVPGVMVLLGAIVELINVGATTLMSLISRLRIVASRIAQRTAASDAADPPTPTTYGSELRPMCPPVT
jgi:hypothetical protein